METTSPLLTNGVEALTERELEILDLLADNYSNQDIATRLHLALSTVKWYLRQMFGKLGVENRHEAVTRGQRLGLLEPELQGSTTIQLPTPATPFTGRETDVQTVVELLTRPTPRLITLVGPGGSGKTRLAIQAATVLAATPRHPFRHGIWFVPLDPLQDPNAIPAAVANAAGVAAYDRRREFRQEIIGHFRPRRGLLILDNFEHLLTVESVQFVADLIQQAPGMKVLVTSRTRLMSQAEQLLPVAGMDLPPEGAVVDGDAGRYPALMFFVDCARRVQPAYTPDAADLAAIARVCRAVQGMPLGIELAAAWMEILLPAQIAAEIDNSLDFLKTDWVDVPDRHRSLRIVFEASWKLLTPVEQTVLAALTVFRGGFSVAAACQVAETGPEVLQALTHKSWLAQQAAGRYEIHTLLRQFADERLRADPAAQQGTQARHTVYFTNRLAQLGEQMRGSQQVEVMEELALEFENVRAAWGSLVEQGAFAELINSALSPLVFYCTQSLRQWDLVELTRQARRALGRHQVQPQAQLFEAILSTIELTKYLVDDINVLPTFTQMNAQHPRFFVESDVSNVWQALSGEPAEETDGQWWVAAAVLYAWRIDLGAGLRRLWRLSQSFARRQAHWLLAKAYQYLGVLYAEHTDFVAASIARARPLPKLTHIWIARALFQAAATLFEQAGDPLEEACSLWLLGSLVMMDDPAQAVASLQKARRMFRSTNNRANESRTLHVLGKADIYAGKAAHGFAYLRQARDILKPTASHHLLEQLLHWESILSVRYGTVENARQTRQMHRRLNGHPMGVAWSHYEMGDVERVAGNARAALRLFEAANEIFRQQEMPDGIMLCHRGQGDVALGQADYHTAEREFRDCLVLAQELPHPWAATYAQCGLGWAGWGLKQYETARQLFGKALRAALRRPDWGLAPIATAGLAAVSAATGELEAAVRLGEVVRQDRMAWKETKQRAQAVLAEVERQRSPEWVAAALAGSKPWDYVSVLAKLDHSPGT